MRSTVSSLPPLAAAPVADPPAELASAAAVGEVDPAVDPAAVPVLVVVVRPAAAAAHSVVPRPTSTPTTSRPSRRSAPKKDIRAGLGIMASKRGFLYSVPNSVA